MEMMVWNIVLSAIVGVMGFMLKGKFDELSRLGGSISVPFKKGGSVKKMAKGGSTASKRADGCATKGKTRGKMV